MTTIANSSEATDDTSVPASASTARDTETSPATGSVATPTVTDMDAEDFRIEDDRYGFILDDGRTACEFEFDADAEDAAEEDASGACHVRGLHGTGGQPAPDTIVFDAGDADKGIAPGIYVEASELRQLHSPDFHVLHANHRVDVGPFSCTALGRAEFRCEMGERTVTVRDGVAEGADFRETTRTGRTDTRTMRPLAEHVAAGADCGHVTSEEFEHIHGPLRVTAGHVDCDEILAIVEEYVNTPMDANHGNWNVRQYGNWSCSMPTAATYERDGQHVACGDGTGNAVAVEDDRNSRG